MSLVWELSQVLRRKFWAWPAAGVVLNVALALGLSSIAVDEDKYAGLRPDVRGVYVVFWTGTADGARDLLGTTSNAAISIVTLTFSLTVLSLQLASTNYSPRILDEFLTDRHTKVTLAVFLGTYAYCWATRWCIRSERSSEPGFVPMVAINVLFLHMLVMLGTFLSFLHYFVDQMRLEQVLQRGLDSAMRAAKATLPKATADDIQRYDANSGSRAELVLPKVPDRALRLRAKQSGYVTAWRLERLVAEAAERGLVVRFQCHIGHFVTASTLLAWVWADSGEFSDLRKAGDLETLEQLANDGLVVDRIRDGQGDVSFGVRQLTDIAVRALSPGINDPQTAIQVLDALSVLFVVLSTRLTENLVAQDEAGVLRVCAPGLDWARLLSMAMDPIRAYGNADVTVVRRALYFLADVGSLCAAEFIFADRVQAVFRQIDQWQAVAKATFGEGSIEYLSVLHSADHARYLIRSAETPLVLYADEHERRAQEQQPPTTPSADATSPEFTAMLEISQQPGQEQPVTAVTPATAPQREGASRTTAVAAVSATATADGHAAADAESTDSSRPPTRGDDATRSPDSSSQDERASADAASTGSTGKGCVPANYKALIGDDGAEGASKRRAAESARESAREFDSQVESQVEPGLARVPEEEDHNGQTQEQTEGNAGRDGSGGDSSSGGGKVSFAGVDTAGAGAAAAPAPHTHETLL